MPPRRRFTPVSGTTSRVVDPFERLLVSAADLLALPLRPLLRRRASADAPPQDVLVLRLDRIGDVLMSLPALGDLRAAWPQARIRLAVGAWSAEVARSAPVDEVLVWSAPWAGRTGEGRPGIGRLLRGALALRREPPDVALDLQGDVRATLLMAASGARQRYGYANTGGARLLTGVLPYDETVSWVEQNRRAVAAVVGRRMETSPLPLIAPDERAEAVRLLEREGVFGDRPLVGIHPSGGRRVKQWDPARWAEVGARLQREFGATVLLTGADADRPLAEAVARGLTAPAVDLTGRLTVRQTLAVIAGLDLFLSPDTGPMHMACAVGTPSVAVFGPSDPVRYFSGGAGTPGSRHVVVRRELWCAPCNLIRRPPAECDTAEPPECLRLVAVDDVHREAARLLRSVGGFAAREAAV